VTGVCAGEPAHTPYTRTRTLRTHELCGGDRPSAVAVDGNTASATRGWVAWQEGIGVDPGCFILLRTQKKKKKAVIVVGLKLVSIPKTVLDVTELERLRDWGGGGRAVTPPRRG